MSAGSLIDSLAKAAGGLGGDIDAYVLGAAVASAALLLVVLAGKNDRSRRDAESREARRRGEELAARRLKEFEELRTRLVALERHAEEMRQAMAARAAMDAAAPAPAAPAPAAALAPPLPDPDAPARPRALVCVAEATAARVFESLLKARGFDVDRCADGIDAAALAARRPPLLAVLDLEATGDDALAIAKAIRAQLSKGGRLLILAPPGIEARQMAPGAELLPKPVDFVAVARLIRGGAKEGVRK